MVKIKGIDKIREWSVGCGNGCLDNYNSVKGDCGSNWGAVQTLIIRNERKMEEQKNECIGAETSGLKKSSMGVVTSLGA